MHLVSSDPPVQPRDRLLRLPDVEQLTGMKKSSIYALMRGNKFPSCVRITRRLSAWAESDVLAWVNQRIREGSAR